MAPYGHQSSKAQPGIGWCLAAGGWWAGGHTGL